MQRFQQILQRAISEGALQVDLSANSSPTGILPNGDADWVDFGNIDPSYFELLFKTLFPSGVTDKPERGQIDIPNFGKLLTIAVPQPIPRLIVFMPTGHVNFESTWNEINMASIPPAPGELVMSDNPFDTNATRTHAAPLPPPPPMNAAAPAPEPAPAPPLAPPAATEPTPPVDMFAPPAAAAPEPMAPPPPNEPVGAPLEDSTTPVEPANIDMFAPPPAAGFQHEAPTPPPLEEPQPPAMDAPAPENIDMFAPPDTPGLATIGQVDPLPEDHNEVSPIPIAVDNNDLVDPVASPPDVDMFASAAASAAATPIPVATTNPTPAPKISKEGKLKTSIDDGPHPIDDMLRFMMEKGASDVHVTMGEPLALRVDGEIVRYDNWKFDEDLFRRFFDPITSEHNAHEFFETNDSDFAYEIPGLARFRVNIFRDRHGPAAVLRQIPSEILSFEQLGLPNSIKKFCDLNKGLVVVTGPTGSGKSTTLAAIVDHINGFRKDHILTLEDPIEFVHPQKNCLIRQREIHKHTTSFARALKAALREDPDIILVGELRDLETTALAIEIAETGHLVMGTLHTTTAVSTIDRIIDQYPADQQEQIRTMLSESLKGVVAQTLLRKKGGGRIAAQEILVVDNAVSALIREGKTHMINNHMQSQKAMGNILLNDALTRRVTTNQVDAKEAYMKAVDKTELVARLRAAGVDLEWYNVLKAKEQEDPEAKKEADDKKAS